MTDKQKEEFAYLRSFTMGFADLLHTIKRATVLEQKTLEQLAMKTTEEVGELNQAVLSFTGAPGCKYKGKTRQDVDEEAIDTIFCAAAVLFRNQPRENMYLAEQMDRKFKIWLDKIEREFE